MRFGTLYSAVVEGFYNDSHLRSEIRDPVQCGSKRVFSDSHDDVHKGNKKQCVLYKTLKRKPATKKKHMLES